MTDQNTKTKKEFGNQTLLYNSTWCAREDLNLHVPKDTST
jgi:hypothetical protein